MTAGKTLEALAHFLGKDNVNVKNLYSDGGREIQAAARKHGLIRITTSLPYIHETNVETKTIWKYIKLL